ncbi:phosphonate ABC transporter, permease protein PhnE [Marinilactibacillus psychrotolerans]|uniref:Phosphonate ABC transporter permease protein n=1 Tax=Marinilactibacillus psychrotolerans TaxID=191770 RepID=A0AAV3WUF7_9LACT|nr:phosphonate ABC transporter, permease protein PhnE [Marinilactibacillus psychrotolerans]GEL67073.1 phosphonate ABC transporter, permease protein PhnE [Marinilactibacillus psychrotolerans]GEQ36218.1 phosphonate ABC transporter permease protein [Marinilactibacillus psychrotolerans]SDC78707.1 phosphonate transport system permease protein [Marinilactibacillus psychrotolerans]
MNEAIRAQMGKAPNRKLYFTTIIIIVLALLIWSTLGVDITGLDKKGTELAVNIVKGIVAPDLEFLFDFSTQGVAYLLYQTIAIAFLGTIFGSILAIPISFLMAPTVVSAPVAYITRLFVIFIRTIPSLVYGIMFIRVTGPGAYAGVLTMSITSIGMISRLYVDVIENLDRGVLEAMTSMGCTTYEKIRYGILPQLFSSFLSTTIYRFDMNLRDATILGLVGAGGIGAPLIFAMRSYRWNQVGAILIGLVLLILLVEVISNKLRSRLVSGTN